MQRGKDLEKEVRQMVSKKLGKKINNAGLIISRKRPMLAASPDGICPDGIVEVKCPKSRKTYANYIKNGGVDVVNQKKEDYTVARITSRWPMRIFFSIFNITGINAQIIYKANTNTLIETNIIERGGSRAGTYFTPDSHGEHILRSHISYEAICAGFCACCGARTKRILFNMT
ncbi:unnamed protein product [Colias eurytheme]|nr:unnamed protein product [Colias eurytheme]